MTKATEAEVPVTIAGADATGLTLMQGSRRWCESWDAIDNIVLARVPWGGNITALAAAISVSGGKRRVLAYEAQAEWRSWIDAAVASLPGVIPPSQWEAALAPNTGLVIFLRHDLPRAVRH